MQPKYLAYLLILFLPSSIRAQFKSDSYNAQPSMFAPLRSEAISFNPIIGDNGTSLWFSRTEDTNNLGGLADQDIWYLGYNEGKWSAPTNDLGDLNSNAQDLIVGQSLNTLVYTVRYERGAESKLTTINAYRKIGERFELDHELQLPYLGIKSNFFGFFVGRDESYVIVSMKGEDTFGKEDLYVCMRNSDGTWSTPIHMGARINTAGFEMSPYMAKDERHLFFSSEGHNGFGNGDIYVSNRLDDTWQNWSKPINLGPNINKAGFEAYFCLNETLEEAYFFSDKDQSNGLIYRIPFKRDPAAPQPNSHQSASGFIKMKQLPAMNVKLNLMDENDQVIQSITTNEDGFFNLQAFLPDKNYKIVLDETVKSELEEAEIFLANDLGDKMIFMNEDELGIFGFKVLSGERFEEVESFENMAKRGKVVDKPTKISGKVSAYGTLTEKVPLKIMNEKNEVLKTIETDEEGYFSFSTDATDRRFFLGIDKDVTGLVDVYEVFLTNDNPEEDIIVSKTDKHLFEFSSLVNGGSSGLKLLDESDYGIPQHFFEEIGMIPSLHNDELIGYLKLDALPIMHAEIQLLDEEDRLIGTAITDSSGRFSFDTDLLEGDYQLQLTDEQSDDLSASEIYLAQNPSDVLVYLNDDRHGVFAFKKLARNQSMTLYSLRDATATGKVVNAELTTLRGKFEYESLPKSGVTLRLMDEDDNVVQETEVNRKGEFEFDRYTTDRNYFISVEAEGLSDIYEIYLSGQNKNVLVNRTDKYVFAFKVLPSKDVVLTQAFETDNQLRLPRMPKYMVLGDGVGDHSRSYHEFDLTVLKNSEFLSLHRIVKEFNNNYQVVLRLYIDRALQTEHVSLQTLQPEDVEPVIERLVDWGVPREHIQVRSMVSDQVLLILK